MTAPHLQQLPGAALTRSHKPGAQHSRNGLARFWGPSPNLYHWPSQVPAGPCWPRKLQGTNRLEAVLGAAGEPWRVATSPQPSRLYLGVVLSPCAATTLLPLTRHVVVAQGPAPRLKIFNHIFKCLDSAIRLQGWGCGCLWGDHQGLTTTRLRPWLRYPWALESVTSTLSTLTWTNDPPKPFCFVLFFTQTYQLS